MFDVQKLIYYIDKKKGNLSYEEAAAVIGITAPVLYKIVKPKPGKNVSYTSMEKVIKWLAIDPRKLLRSKKTDGNTRKQ